MAPSPLEICPPEILEHTAQYLDLDDLRELRLTNKALAGLVARGTFQRYYRTKHVDVAPESLAEFVQMTRSGLLGADVENLVLTGVAIDTQHLTKVVEEKARWETEGNGPIFASTQHKLSSSELAEAEQALEALRARRTATEDFHRSGEDVDLLAEAFGNIAAYGKNGKLPSLTLEVAILKEGLTQRLLPIQSRELNAVWETAEKVFRAAMGGLAGSGVPVQKLDAFTDQWQCSLSAGALGRIRSLPGQKLGEALKHLQSLSLSLSADVNVEKKMGGYEDEGQDLSGDVAERCRAEGLADLLSECRSLKHLHLHWFLLRSIGVDSPLGETLLERAVNSNRLSSLQSLTLRGLRFKGPTLLAVLQSAQIQDLRLDNVSIKSPNPDSFPGHFDEEPDYEAGEWEVPQLALVTSSVWTAIFQHCTSKEADMSALYFNDLWGTRILHFHGEPGGESKLPWTPPTGGGETLDRRGEDVRKEIKYGYARGRPMGSPQAYRWRQIRGRDYGPA